MAAGILSALMFSFTGSALWLIQERDVFADGYERGLSAIFW